MIKIKVFICAVLILIFFNIFCFAKTKTYIKEGSEEIKSNQTQEEVEEHLKQRLITIAIEEAGQFISTSLQIENNKITKDIFSNIAGALTKTEVIERKYKIENEKPGIYIKLKIEIDTYSVENYLDKVKKNDEEVSELKEKIEELESKLRNTQNSAESENLSNELAMLVEQRKQKEIEFDKMVLDAKEEYKKIQQEQKKQEFLRLEEINALRKKIELEEVEMKRKIAQEKDNIKKQELENQQRIMNIENNAKQNMLSFNKKEKLSIQEAVKEANNLKQEINKIVANFDDLLIINETNIEESYDKQIEILKKRKFLEEKPVKDKYEETLEFNNRVKEYEERKKSFIQNNKNMIQELKDKRKVAVINDETDTLKGMVKTAQPFVEKIMKYQKQELYDKNIKYIKPNSTSQIDVDNKYFYIYFEYQKTNYSYKINYFEKKEGIAMYETADKQFVIQPYFTIKENNNNIYVPLLLGFKIKHLGINKKYDYKLANVPKMEDIDFYKTILKHSQDYKQINKIILKEKINIIREKKEKIKQSNQKANK